MASIIPESAVCGKPMKLSKCQPILNHPLLIECFMSLRLSKPSMICEVVHPPNAPGERRPTGKNPRNSQKTCAVGRPLHWVVRRLHNLLLGNDYRGTARTSVSSPLSPELPPSLVGAFVNTTFSALISGCLALNSTLLLGWWCYNLEMRVKYLNNSLRVTFRGLGGIS
jgi:hypothetical protein